MKKMMERKMWPVWAGIFLLFACGNRTAADGETGNGRWPLPDPPAEISGIWSSRAELALLPMTGPGWREVLTDASKDTSHPDVGNQDDNTNCYVLAAAIVSERLAAAGSSDEAAAYRKKVVDAVERIVRDGQPEGSRTLAWGREISAYAMAADLVGYRTEAFERYLKEAADGWICSARHQTLHEMTLTRPNNWGSMGLGTMCAIYAYLGDQNALHTIRDIWMTTLNGPSAEGFKYGDDLSWQADPSRPMIINPAGTVKEGLSLDGLQPEEMRRGAPFSARDIAATGYPFEALQGWIMAARILERQGMPIWEEGDRALYRAVYALQVYLTERCGPSWAFAGDDLWILEFVDRAYGSDFAKNQNVWGHGKNAGYPYVAQFSQK